jgi:hypothetical protein
MNNYTAMMSLGQISELGIVITGRNKTSTKPTALSVFILDLLLASIRSYLSVKCLRLMNVVK